jgi:hypothetical protein
MITQPRINSVLTKRETAIAAAERQATLAKLSFATRGRVLLIENVFHPRQPGHRARPANGRNRQQGYVTHLLGPNPLRQTAADMRMQATLKSCTHGDCQLHQPLGLVIQRAGAGPSRLNASQTAG